MSDRKITAPGPGWRMPGRAKSTNIRDAMPNLLNAMGDSIERSNKMDFGTPGIHTQNGFQQPHETTFNGPVWVLLSNDLPSGDYSNPSNALAKMLVRDSTIGENSLVEGPDDVEVWNYSQNFSANTGDWVMALPFGKSFAVIPTGGSGSQSQQIDFEIIDWVASDPLTGPCEAAYAEVLRVSCGSTVNIGDTVIVHDPELCWFDLPTVLLIGSVGSANLMDSDGIPVSELCDVPITSACSWVVQRLCCREEVYAD